MANRPSREETYLYIAWAISKRGTCQRKQAGAVITSMDNRIISTGYNGAINGIICKDNCDTRIACKHAIHAEANAIYHAAKHGIQLLGAKMYCTDSPCEKCAEAIIQSGIENFYYLDEYRDLTGLELLIKSPTVSCHNLRRDQLEFFEL